MRVLDDVLDLQWASPLDALGDLPTAVVYGLVLTFAHTAGKQALGALRTALEPHLGQATTRRALLGERLEWSGRTLAEADVRRAKATLRLGQKLKPNRVAELVKAVAEVPGASGLRLKASVRRFLPPGPDGPAMDG